MKSVFVCIVFLANFNLIFAQSTGELLHREALANIEQGKYGEAIELLNRFISANPQNPEGFNLRGKCFEKRGLYEQALYDYRSALKLDPDNSKFQSNISRVTEEFNKLLYNDISGYKREIAINPEVACNYLEIGKCYKKLGEWQEAENWYDKYLKREEASSDEILRYTEILAKNGHISKGEPILKRYTKKDPDDHRLWSRYGYFTMWLGKKKIALEAFENALKLRPYFKEAIDGYDLVRGKGYVYTINDTTSRYNYGLPLKRRYKPYPIDNYYRKLKKNPEDISTRYLLIDELVKNNRYEEAVDQLNFLDGLKIQDDRLDGLRAEVLDKREKYYDSQIASLELKLSSKAEDKKIIFELVEYYSLKEDYLKANMLLSDYLLHHPEDYEVRYKKAVMLSRAGNLSDATREMEIVISHSPSNIDYKLLYGQLLVWTNENLDVAEENLSEVLKYKPDNLNAMIALSNLYFQRNDLISAQKYVNEGLVINLSDKDLLQLNKSIEIQKTINAKNELYNLLEKAREYVFRKKCEQAITYYNIYFEKPGADPYLKKELAEAYLCNNNYYDALMIYGDLVNEFPGDYSLFKQRAKIYYWSGDSLSALNEFEKLSRIDKDDAEVKLFLGDSYMKVKDYKNARKVYEELLAISPTSHILQTRMKWLGNEGLDDNSISTFPTYFSLIPDASYFTDNVDFTYSTQGLRAELGVTSYLSLSVSGYLGYVSSESERLNLNLFRADAYLKFTKYVTGQFGAGILNFKNVKRSDLFSASIKAEKEKKYKFEATFTSADAIHLLYSPYLVNVRLNANYILLSGKYITNEAILLAADFAYISVSDNNQGNRLNLKVGKVFDEIFSIGYEYYYYNFKTESDLYWSPKNFEVHSGWIDWNAINENNFNLQLSAKVGYDPRDSYVVKEFDGIFNCKFTDNFTLQMRSSFGSSVKFNQGYNSVSFGVTAYWTL